MDPRVKITPDVRQIFTYSTQMEDNARNARASYDEARALVDKVKARPQSAANDALLKELDAIAPVEAAVEAGGGGRAGRGGRGGAAGFAAPGGGFGAAAAEPPAPPNLANIGVQNVAAAQALQGAEMAPTVAELEACAQQQTEYASLMAKWAALKAKINGPAAAPAAGGAGAKKK
jgi:hypothetical protein